MELTLMRKATTNNCTPGVLYVGDEWFCHTLEPADMITTLSSIMGYPPTTDDILLLKKRQYIAIPTGLYRLKLQFWSKHENYYPLLLHVPAFEGIFIHGGNTVADTKGCILLGEFDPKINNSYRLRNSAHYVRKLVKLLNDHAADQHHIRIIY